MDTDEVLARFESVQMTEDQQSVVADLRVNYMAAAMAVVDTVPDSRARNVALTALEDSLMWAVKAVAHG